MFIKMKKRITDLIDTVSECLEMLCQLSTPLEAIEDCLSAADAILFQLNQEKSVPVTSIAQIKNVQASLRSILVDISQIDQQYVKDINDQVLLFKKIFEEEVRAKLNVVFMPYKVSMWDSLATVFEAANKDEECEVKVVPIPYYQLSQDEAIPTYEGDRFPEDVPITHYSLYNLEQEQPDIVFVHNIYDQYNAITRVYEQYYTSNIKKFTDMLVYIPYHVSSFIPPKQGEYSFEYGNPSVVNVDKIILSGDYLKQAAIRDGIPEEKLLVLGSPKLDAMVKAMNEMIPYPKEWEGKIAGKTVYLLNTGVLYFTSNPLVALERLIDFFNIPRLIENSVLIWRPHPLTNISIRKYTPFFLDYYLRLTEDYIKRDNPLYKGIILDETDDYLPALQAADVLISSEASLLRSYLLTEKKVLFLEDSLPKESLLPSDVFYYAYNQSEPWFELVRKFSKGYDPLAEKRKGMAENVYVNSDGTSGRKVYNAIKDLVLIKQHL